jgi:ribosomal protein S2
MKFDKQGLTRFNLKRNLFKAQGVYPSCRALTVRESGGGLLSERGPADKRIGKFLISEFFQDLIKTKAHLGTNIWTKDMSKFLLGSRNGISIINIEYTLICLRQVLKFLEIMKLSGGGWEGGSSRVLRGVGLCPPLPPTTPPQLPQSESRPPEHPSSMNNHYSTHILFVNTSAKFSELVKQTALKSNQSYINERWIGGTLTNWKQISESILLYNKFSTQFDTFLRIHNIQIPMYEKAKKRYEGLNILSSRTARDVLRREAPLRPRSAMNRNTHDKVLSMRSAIPDVIILTNPDENNIVIKEAQLFKIPVIAFADTNTKTLGIDYIIPGNNKSISFMYFCLNLITITLQGKVFK